MKRRGLTLMEAVISLAVVTLIGGVMVGVYLSLSRITTEEGHRVDVDLSAHRPLAVMDGYLRQGKNIAQSFVDGPTTYTTGPETLVLEIPSLLADGSLSPTAVDTLIFFHESGVLRMLLRPDPSSTRPGEDRTITDRVQSLYFRFADPQPTSAKGLTATITTLKTVGSTNYRQTFILYGALRNPIS